ncbi:predicted protein [Botrytis cinerea T4]|uniref:Uncharacterized protein n=1 Tax=Botryotinia fuckeliana (strain T4) TaxID=999810 RepID=G2XN75_BOTF4|nr:predicted protein [Botrytis cinerea T4]
MAILYTTVEYDIGSSKESAFEHSLWIDGGALAGSA